MEADKSSQTAQFVAILRAHHDLFAPGQKLLEDNLALTMSGLPGPDAVKGAVGGLIAGYAQLGGQEVAEAFVQQVEHSVCMRSRLVEERLQATLGSGLEQLVILGAGLDTAAYRHAEQLSDIAVFEVDHPATQSWKRQQLTNAGIDIPANLKFVSFDFENQTLADAFEAGGVANDKQTLFTWLGVLMYLSQDAIRSTLSVLADFPGGSELVLDFVPDTENGAQETVVGSIDELAKQVAEMGEPILSRYTPQRLESELLSAGFGKVDFYSGNRIIKEILGGDKEAFCMPNDVASLLCAQI